jgi:hypothetical protein
MSEYADGFDDGKGEKFDELMVEIVSLRLDFQNCEAKRVGAINSLREHINICNGLKIENAALREQLKEAQDWGEPVAWCWMDEEIGFGLPPDAVSKEATLLYAKKEEWK